MQAPHHIGRDGRVGDPLMALKGDEQQHPAIATAQVIGQQVAVQAIGLAHAALEVVAVHGPAKHALWR